MELSRQHILIVGNKGMLAHALARKLIAAGARPVGVDLPECDITRPESIDAVMKAHRPEVLFNCAAYTNVDGCEKEPAVARAVNTDGPGHLAQACKDAGCRLVHISTDFVFDGHGTRPYQVTDIPAPLSEYGRSKLGGEQLIRQVHPPGWIIARTAWLFGAAGNCFPRAIINAAKKALAENPTNPKPLTVVSDQVGCPTHADDLSEALLGLVQREAGGLWHITNNGQTNWCDFARHILKVFELPIPVEPITSAQWKALRPASAHRPGYSVLDLSPVEAILGRPMPRWQNGLAEYRRQMLR